MKKKTKNKPGDELENLEIELVPRLDLPSEETEAVLEIETLDDGWDASEDLELEPADASSDFYVNPGDIIADKYRVEEVLGVGGMAFVVAVTHVELGERFALKFLNRDLLEEPNVVDRFTQEARAACRIRSEHVARVYDVGTHRGAPFFVMEHLEGRDLAMVLAQSADRKGLPIGQAVEWVMQACDALAVAHHHGIIHRDIKPENLFLVEHSGLPSIKLLDFGISKISLASGATSGVDARLTGQFSLGTPSYMSPEQIRSAASADVRSDLWSLGVVLYELLAGVEPFRAPTIPELCAAVCEEEPRRVGDLRPEIPRELSNIVHKCLEKDPDHRYAHVAELAMALMPFAPSRALVSVERSSELMKRTPTPTSGITPSSQRLKAAPAIAAARQARTKQPRLGAQPPGEALPDLRVDEDEDPSARSGRPVSRSVTPIPPPSYGSRLLIALAAAVVLLSATGFAAIRLGQPPSPPSAPTPAQEGRPVVSTVGVATATSAEVSQPEVGSGSRPEEAPRAAIHARFTREKEFEPMGAPDQVVTPRHAPVPAAPARPRSPASTSASAAAAAAAAAALPLAPAPGPASSATIELGY